ncbi:hypothetical protein GCM10028778_17060 [Barrientosiimonas marina]|uniref:hypothetical protein n=1 Tax=Lentibacillus kimchii TaxID=1542911 RepID=UPI0036D34B6C
MFNISFTFAGSAVSATMVGVFTGSLGFGYLTDRIGAKYTALLAMVSGLLSMILLHVFPVMIETGT